MGRGGFWWGGVISIIHLMAILITINGEKHEVGEGATVADLLALFKLGARCGWRWSGTWGDCAEGGVCDDTVVGAGDQIEIVTFVGGG